jgi:hypothetical protein
MSRGIPILGLYLIQMIETTIINIRLPKISENIKITKNPTYFSSPPSTGKYEITK